MADSLTSVDLKSGFCTCKLDQSLLIGSRLRFVIRVLWITALANLCSVVYSILIGISVKWVRLLDLFLQMGERVPVRVIVWVVLHMYSIQGWPKESTLGCVNPASDCLWPRGGELTQPREDHSLAHPCTYTLLGSLFECRTTGLETNLSFCI